VLSSGIASVDSPSQQVVTQAIGNVSAGGVSHEEFHLIVTGGTDTVQHIVANLTYNTAGSSARFETTMASDIPVGQSAIGVSVKAPASVFSGQDFPITVTYDNNTDEAITGASLAMQYPTSSDESPFAFVKADSSPSLTPDGDNSWSLGTIPPNGTGTIVVTGNLVGAGGSGYQVGADLTLDVAGQPYTVASPEAGVEIALSPLSLSLSVNRSNDYVAKPGDDLEYALTFTNNSDVTFQDILVSANLVGRMFNLPSVATAGAFNSISNTITWNAAAAHQLLSLAPGQSGVVTFGVGTLSAFPIRLLSDKDYTVTVNARIASPTVPTGTAASSTVSVTSLTTKFRGNIVLDEQAYHNEPANGTGGSEGPTNITNAGPYPPKVNQSTEYTVHWLITNYATDAQNVTISAYLQSGTTCAGITLAPASSTLTCDSANGLVEWQVPMVAATTGITGKPLEAVFQIANTPGSNQVGGNIALVGPVTLTATDAFTGTSMQSSVGAVSTALPDDTSISTFNRRVTN
jgi:hypothetical protein